MLTNKLEGTAKEMFTFKKDFYRVLKSGANDKLNKEKEEAKMDAVTENAVLKELREFRAENNKRWDENDKRWEANEKRWKENERRWETNEKRWKENEQRWEENEQKWERNENRWIASEERNRFYEKRLNDFAEARQKERKELMQVLDNMQKSITSQFAEMKQYIDKKVEPIEAMVKVHEKALKIHEGRINFQNSRITSLEEWKDEMENGQMFAV